MFLILVMTFVVSLVGSAKSFYYYGVGFHHENSWKISASPNGIIGVNGESRIYINTSRLEPTTVKSTSILNNKLDAKVEEILDQSYGNKKMKLRKKSEVLDGDINDMPAKYVDITFSGGVCKRYYCLEWKGYLIEVEISGKGKGFQKAFKKIFKSFSFVPEVR